VDSEWRKRRAAELLEIWRRAPDDLLQIYFSVSTVIETDHPSLDKVIQTILDAEESNFTADSDRL
jgi:hypothetical protein